MSLSKTWKAFLDVSNGATPPEKALSFEKRQNAFRRGLESKGGGQTGRCPEFPLKTKLKRYANKQLSPQLHLITSLASAGNIGLRP